MTGDYALTLPVMLAVAIATAMSRALSYGSIYTTKLLRRGTDIDRAAPWRAFGDLKAADAMRPFPAPLPVPAGPGAPGTGSAATGTPPVPAILGEATGQGDPQAVYAGESLAQTLRQLAAYGRDGLPVLSADGQQVRGWITNASVLQAVASKIGTSPPRATDSRRRGRAPRTANRPTRCPATRYWNSRSAAQPRQQAAPWAASASRPEASRYPSCATGSCESPTPASSSPQATESACSHPPPAQRAAPCKCRTHEPICPDAGPRRCRAATAR